MCRNSRQKLAEHVVQVQIPLDLNAQNSKGESSLVSEAAAFLLSDGLQHILCERGLWEFCILLIDVGASASLLTVHNETPLHYLVDH